MQDGYMRRGGGYRRQFLIQWAIFAATMIGFAGLIAYTLYLEHGRIQAREEARLFAQARVIDENMATQLKSADSVLLRLRDELRAGTPDADVTAHLTIYEQAIPGIRTLIIMDAAGDVRLANRPELVGRNLSQREYFKVPRDSPGSARIFISPPFKTVLGTWALNLTRVLIGPKGEFAGIVTATLEPQYFTTLLASVQYAPDLRAVIAHADGDIFLMVPDVQPVQGMNIAKPGSFFSRHIASGRGESVFSGATYATGEQRIVAFRTSRAAGLPLDKPPVLIVTRDLDAVFEGWFRDVKVYGALLVATALLVALVMALAQLRQRSQRRRIEMADRQLRDSEERFRALFQFSADAILVHPLEGEQGGLGPFVEVNDAALERYGYSKEELQAMTPLDLDEVRTYPTPEDLEAFKANARKAGHLIFERVHVAKDGRRIPVEVNAHIFKLKGQEMMLSIVRDVSERKRTEAALRTSEQRWSFALEGGGDCVWDWDMPSDVILLSKAGKRMFGFAEDEIADRMEEWEKRAHPDDKQRIREDFKAYLQGETPSLVSEYRMQCKDGSWKWILTRGMVVARDENGRAVRMVGTHSDVTERREREEALRLAGAVFETVDEGVLVTDAKGHIVAVNPGFTAITGYAEEDVLGKDPRILSSGKNSPEFYREMWAEINATGAWRGEVLNRRKSGEFFVEWLAIKRIDSKGGEASHYVGVFSDISERKASEERMRYLAHYDALTDLPNRTLLEDRAAQALSRARRDKTRVGVLFFDLDKFKPVNDRFGHDVGDLLLKEVARRVLVCVRESDTVARLGGDEFVVVLPEIAQTEDAVMVADKILAELNEPFEVSGHRIEIGASIGVAVYPEHARDEMELVKHADEAMYQAKAAGRNTVSVWRPGEGSPGA
jgi:diguanylate cyclase (GGDEF)-like protein/PAS domain S-box-containing protein